MNETGVNDLVARSVRAEMARAGRSQTDIATVLGVAQSAVSCRMLGITQWKVSELVAVAKYLGCGLDCLLPDLALEGAA